jgi:DNA-directed RNA polymerase specialized sigma24 family protein
MSRLSRARNRLRRLLDGDLTNEERPTTLRRIK